MRRLLSLVVLLRLIVCLLMVSSPSSASAETTIRVTLQLPESHSLGQNWRAFDAILRERSEGDLRIQLFPSAQLFRDRQAPEAVGTGAIDAGSVFLGRFAGAVPAVDVVSLPFLFEDEAHLRAATAPGSPMRALLDAAILAETGARVLWWQAFGRNVYLSNDRGIRTPADMDGRRVRTYGRVQSWTVEALGGAPTLISGTEQFLAYQQGVVDIGMTGATTVRTRSLYEVMDHMTLSFDSAIEFVAVINNDLFEGLSEDEQQIVLDAAEEVEAQLRDHIYSEEREAIAEVAAQMTIVELTDEERAAWVEATSGVVERFVADGGDLARRVIDAARRSAR